MIRHCAKPSVIVPAIALALVVSAAAACGTQSTARPEGSPGAPALPAWSASSPGSSRSPATSGSAAPSQTPAPSAGIAWVQVVGGADVLMMDVVAVPGGVVAVGGARPATRAPSPGLATSGPAGPGDCRTHVGAATCAGPVAWIYAADGREQRVGPLGSDGGALQRVAWTGSSLVAIGCLGQLESQAGVCARPVVWVSTDGAAWTPATVPPTPAGSTGIILRDVLAVSGAIVVAGCLTEASGDTAEPECSAAAVWRSTDGGRTWGPPELPDGPTSTSQVMALGTDGTLVVAAGFTAEPWEERIWTCAEGATWERAEIEPAFADDVDRVVHAAGKWLATGPKGDETAVWASDDGRTWQSLPDMAGRERVNAIAPVSDGLVALGSVDAVPVVWTSRDGVAWDPTPGFALQDAELAVVGDRIVAVGREGIWVSDSITAGLDIR